MNMTTSEQKSGVAGLGAPPALRSGTSDLPAVRALPDAVPSARNGRKVWFWGAGIILAAGLGLTAYLQLWAQGPIPVATEVAQLAPVTRVLAVNGRIAALHSVDVRAQTDGPLSDVLVAEGDVVRSGANLARIDNAGQRAVLRQAVAGLDAALVAQEQAVATFARTEALAANVTRTALENAARDVRAAAQEVARMTALVDQAQIQLATLTISAPIGGTVLALNAEPGQIVDSSTVLFTIADLSQLIVETDVDEAYATQIRSGQPAHLQLAGETVIRHGRVDFVSQRVDATTGGLSVKLAFDEAVMAPVGLTVTANIIVDQLDAALTVPRAALSDEESTVAIFVVVDDLATRRAVTVTDWPAARLVVTDGLAPGDVVITDTTGIVDGQPVQAGVR